MDLRETERLYNQAASKYDQHDALEREVGQRLGERMAFIRRQPETILDLGCGTGQATLLFRKQFPDSNIIGMDLSSEMLRSFSEKIAKTGISNALQGDLTSIPLASRSVDLVYSNMALQWAGDLVHALNEIRRILKPEGMFLFSLPGPESLREIRQARFLGMDASMPIYMPDLRDVGDCLQSAGFRDPVMDTESITLNYQNGAQMQAELQVTGGAGFSRLSGDIQSEAEFDLTFEIVYGTAFGPADGQPIRTPEGEVATFSVENLIKL